MTIILCMKGIGVILSRATLGLHLDDRRHLPPDIGTIDRRPLVGGSAIGELGVIG